MTPKALSREITTREAVERLIKALNEESDYRYSWQANIAVAMQDAYRYSKDKSDIHAISNEGAIRFLDILTKENK